MKEKFLKVVLLGDSSVGKTAIRRRFCHGIFNNSNKATIGCDFVSRTVKDDNCDPVTLQIWDTAGQERFNSLASCYYRGADVCILCVDASNPTSLSNLAFWHRDFIEFARISKVPLFSFYIVINKIDLEPGDRWVSEWMGWRASFILHDISKDIMKENDDWGPNIISKPRPLLKSLSRNFKRKSETALKSLFVLGTPNTVNPKERLSPPPMSDHELDSFPTFRSAKIRPLSHKESLLSFQSFYTGLETQESATSTSKTTPNHSRKGTADNEELDLSVSAFAPSGNDQGALFQSDSTKSGLDEASVVRDSFSELSASHLDHQKPDLITRETASSEPSPDSATHKSSSSESTMFKNQPSRRPAEHMLWKKDPQESLAESATQSRTLFPVFRVSALTGQGVQELFQHVATHGGNLIAAEDSDGRNALLDFRGIDDERTAQPGMRPLLFRQPSLHFEKRGCC